MHKLKVGVIMGGESSEREVSLMSGREMLRPLDGDKYEIEEYVFPQDIDRINKDRMEVALIALHGVSGEDGAIQRFLETQKIKYTGAGVLASAIGMNKKIFKKLAQKEGFLTPKEVRKAPCVIKPNNGGSSVGVRIVKDQSEVKQAIEAVEKYEKEWIMEEYIRGVEVACGVLGDQALPIVEIVPKKDFFDYEAKYTTGMAEEICPARISKRVALKIQKESKRICSLLGIKSYARIDFIIKKGKAYMLEINTLPGMTANSLLPKEAAAIGMNYSQLLDKIIELALKKPL